MAAATAAFAAALLALAAGSPAPQGEAAVGRPLLFLSSRSQPPKEAANGTDSSKAADAVGRAFAFQHPGVLVSQGRLDWMRSQVAAQAEPMYTAYLKALAAPIGALDYWPHGPPATGFVECGPYGDPNIGCEDEMEDASAAVLQSYLWVVTGNSQYATNAVRIMDTWAANLRGHTNSNAPLQSGWVSAKWSKAAEVIIYTAGWSWPDDRRQAFLRCLTDVYLPDIVGGSGTNGNWELTMIDAMIGIAVLTDNGDLFNQATTFWRERVPAYIYVSSDGSQPRPPPRGFVDWNQAVFDWSVDGIAQETCRDLGHTSMGLASMINAAETASLQGVDLYGEEQDRIVAGLEFQTNLLQSDSAPSYICNGVIDRGTAPTYEIAYNHYALQKGLSLPHTLQQIERETRTRQDLYDQTITTWETLTHGA